jgi:hypothetical protein
MAAEFEEVVVTSHAFHAQQFLPDVRQGLFDLTLWRFVGLARISVIIGCRQGAPIKLPVGCQWHCVGLHEGGGHHVVGQPGGQMTAQRDSQLRIIISGHIGDQPLATLAVLDGQYRGLAHKRMPAQVRFYLT